MIWGSSSFVNGRMTTTRVSSMARRCMPPTEESVTNTCQMNTSRFSYPSLHNFKPSTRRRTHWLLPFTWRTSPPTQSSLENQIQTSWLFWLAFLGKKELEERARTIIIMDCGSGNSRRYINVSNIVNVLEERKPGIVKGIAGISCLYVMWLYIVIL